MSMLMTPTPTFGGPLNVDRQTHTRRRRRILYGEWRPDLVEALQRQLGTVRGEVYKYNLDMSCNPARVASSWHCALYDSPPKIEHASALAAETVKAALEQANWWAYAPRLQRDTIALREMLVRVEGILDEGLPSVRLSQVWPDMVTAEPDPADPRRALVVRELVARIRDGQVQWMVDVWDARGEGSYRIETTDGRDITSDYFEEPPPYPYVDQRGRPVTPYVWYHAAESGSLWDPYEQCELWYGTVNLGVQWTFYQHALKNASWPQRIIIGLVPVGATVEGEDGEARQVVTTDPSVVLQLTQAPGADREGRTEQWDAGIDPTVIATAASEYERRLLEQAGVEADSVTRRSSDPRSAVAIVASRELRREVQRRYAPVFAPSDERLCELIAIAYNSVGLSLPTDGYSVHYLSLPPSPEERQRDHMLIADVQRRMHSGEITREAAISTLQRALAVEAEEASNLLNAPVVDETEASASALNGAQLQSAQSIVQSVAAGTLPRDSGVQLLATGLGIPTSQAEEIMGEAGRSFVLTVVPDAAVPDAATVGEVEVDDSTKEE